MSSVFHPNRWICQHPRMKAVMGIAARKARPALLCFRPVRTRVGGLSTTDLKLGSISAGLLDCHRRC
ncbi:hypothetical protein KC332_g72 [Hortaea werneckii]|nr:hypothetical protein KC348_g78 [Hortaea werneckii]KAI7421969.1 hypothetical protein KC332_g72 [Hortaea werneckii]